MTKNQLNLITADFQRSNLFRHLPNFDAIYYEGHPEGKIQKYKAMREEDECVLLALTIIKKEEDILWSAAEDLLERCLLQAAGAMRGIFTFDLLTFDIHQEKDTFNYLEFGTVIANTSRKIAPGEQKMVKYSSAYGILQKMVAEDWGKIALKTSVEVFKDKPSFLFSVIKRLFKLAGYPNNPLILLVHDLSAEPIYDPSNAEQNKMIQKTIAEQKENLFEFLPEVYLRDKNGMRELVSGMVVQ